MGEFYQQQVISPVASSILRHNRCYGLQPLMTALFRVLFLPNRLPIFSCGLWLKTVQVMIKGSQKHANTESKIAVKIEKEPLLSCYTCMEEKIRV